MISQVEAVFENGLLRPLVSLPFEDQERVVLTITTPGAPEFALSEDRWAAFQAALDSPPKSIPALRTLLSEPGVFDGRSAGA